MSSQLIPFNATDNLPAYLQDPAKVKDLNKDVASFASFPTLSIRGKRFTISRDGIKKVLMKPGTDDEEVAQHIGLVVLRANMHSKVFYLKKFTEGGDSEGQRPDCYSLDGVAPSVNAVTPQAKKCGACPHNVWGSRISDRDDGGEAKGKACADNARLAISAPDKIDPMLLRVPPASLKALRDAVKLINQRDIPYNSVVMKVGFDIEASSPKLTFKPVGILDEGTYKEVSDQYDGEIVRGIVGADDVMVEAHEPDAKPPVSGDELDAALAAREAVNQVKEKSKEAQADPAAAEVKPKPTKPKVAPKPSVEDELAGLVPDEKPKPETPETKAAAKVEATKPTASGADKLLSDLDSLLGNSDD